MLVSGSLDASVKIWETASGIELANLYVGSSATCVCFSHDSETVTLDPRPYTLHPTPYTLHPTPYTLHPTPYTLDFVTLDTTP